MSGFESLLSADFNNTATADLTLFNSIGVTNAPPILSGNVDPEKQGQADIHARGMKEAEQKIIDRDEIYDEVKPLLTNPSSDFTVEEMLANLDAERRQEYEKRKAKYQADKSQWLMHGTDMKAESYVDGFDDYPDDDDE